jgi:hypothetical protein
VTPLYTNIDNLVIAQNDYATTPLNTLVTMCLLCNDSDPNNDAIGVPSIISNPSHGNVVVNNDGSVSYTPNTGFIGSDVYTYTICDNGSPQACDTAEAFVTITPVPITNNQTYANDDAYVTGVNIAKSGNVGLNDTDPQNDAVTFSRQSNPAHGALVFNIDGTFTYTPDSNYQGPDQFIYAKCDNGTPVACDTATVYINMMSLLPQTGLPLTLLDFYVIEAACTATLYWSSEQEKDVAHFDIEKKNADNIFEKIGTVAAKGNNHTVEHYSFKDMHVSSGLNEYRLRIVDVDSKYTYSSNTAFVSSCTGDDLITLYPNPAATSTNLLISTKNDFTYSIKMIDIFGQTVYQTSVDVRNETKILSIPIQHLATGIYNILITDGNDVNVIRFTKQGK